MGARVWHAARAKHHKEVADFLQSKYPDWAAVALFYSALSHVHSSLADEPTLVKDERHPRKHTAKAGEENAGRGVNQLVRDLYPEIHTQYRSLFEMSRRTRYDHEKMGNLAYPMLLIQWRDVAQYCQGRNQGRPTIPTAAP